MKKFGSLVQRAWKKLKLSRFCLGMISGVTPNTIAKIEAGEGGHLESAMAIAYALKIENITVEASTLSCILIRLPTSSRANVAREPSG
jgi:hypothetical protein